MARSLIVWAFAAAMLSSPAMPAQLYVIAAANVAMRAAPGINASPIASVKLGSEGVELEHNDAADWHHLRMNDGSEGWVRSDLVRPVAPDQRMPALESLMFDRLARRDDGFVERAELVEFIERLISESRDREALARLAWYRLRALAATLDAIPKFRDNMHAINHWMAVRGDYVAVWNEPAARWMLDPGFVRRISLGFHGTAVADELAWFATTNGLQGECEGYVLCYIDSMKQTNVHYLQFHPDGRHVGEALDRIRLFERDRFPKDSLDPNDCPRLVEDTNLLRKIVGLTRHSDRDAALARIDVLRQWCP